MEDNLKDMLNEPPPQSALKSRSQSGRSLTYIEGHYVIETMNRIFGPDNWHRTFTGNGLYVVDKTEAEVTKNNVTKTRYDVSMLCETRVTATKTGNLAIAEDVGFGIGQSYNGWGDAFESAAKEAVTDALKRCCRSLGNALGNCLYDKEWLKHKGSGGKTKPKAPPSPAPKPKVTPNPKPDAPKKVMWDHAQALLVDSGAVKTDAASFKDITTSLILDICKKELKKDSPNTNADFEAIDKVLGDKERMEKYMAPTG